MLNYGNFALAKLQLWLTTFKCVNLFTFLAGGPKISVNKGFTGLGLAGRLIVSKWLMCHYKSWIIAAPFNQEA
jgi:hypothetical protein